MPQAAVFDAYGTLLDVHAAMAAHADKLPPDWERISQEWRQKQLEYSWVRSLAGPAHHRDFWHVTQEALAFVAARHRVNDPETRAALLDAYRRLPAYHDALPTLRRLRAQGMRTAILSNGEPAMLADAVRAAGLDAVLDAVLSVEDVGVFKPDPRVYQLAVDRLGAAPGETVFVSSNAWDAYGALAFGLQVAWCNRAQGPDEYGLRGRVQEIAGLDALAA
jgi:2-haloacid dehalogenase